MIQTLPFPGSYQSQGERIEDVIDEALEQARVLSQCGFDGAIVQNMKDMPIVQHSSMEAVAYMTAVSKEIKRNFPNLSLGILMNWDGAASLCAAEASGADFVRVEHLYTGAEVTSAGILTAQCVEICALRKKLNSAIPVYADIYETHGMPICKKDIGAAAWESVYEAFADGLYLAGKSVEESIDMCVKAKKKVDVPIIVGGGATCENVYELLKYFDGVCVASGIKDGAVRNPINKDQARRFCEEVARAKADAVNLYDEVKR